MCFVELSVNVWEKNGECVASCPELEIFCYGIDEKQARARLKKVISFYAETASDLGYDVDLAGLSTEDMDSPKPQGMSLKKNTPVFS